MGGLKKGAWKTAVATLMSINLKPRKNSGISSCLPQKGVRIFLRLPPRFLFYSQVMDRFVSLKPRLLEEIAMNVSRKEMTFIDRFRENLYLEFFSVEMEVWWTCGDSQEAPFCFYTTPFLIRIYIQYIYIYAVVCFRALLVYFGVNIWGFMLTKYVFAVATALAKTYTFFVATHWKFEFPLQDASREMKVGIGWDPTLKHMILVVKSQHRWRSFQTPKSN